MHIIPRKYLIFGILLFAFSFYCKSQTLPSKSKIEAFYQISYAKFSNDMVVYIDAKEHFLPLSQVLTFLKIYYEFDYYSSEIRGYVNNTSQNFVLNYKDKNFSYQNQTLAISDTCYYFEDFELYVNSLFLKSLLDIDLEIINSKLIIILKSQKVLPILDDYLRRKKYDLLREGKGDSFYPLMFDRSWSILNGAMLKYSINSDFVDNNFNTSVSYLTGIELIGGDLNIQGTLQLNELTNTIRNNYNYRWRYSFGTNPFLTQFSFGDISTSGQRFNGLPSYSIYGAQLTNETIRNDYFFGNLIFEDKIEPNWQIELYLNGILTDQVLSDLSGYYKFLIPVNYGNYNVQLKYYGPKGEFESERDLIVLPSEFLRAGEVKYLLNYGKLNNQDLFGDGKLSVGIFKWLSNSISVDKKLNQDEIKWHTNTSFLLFDNFVVRFGYSKDRYFQGNFNLWTLDYGSYSLSHQLADPNSTDYLNGLRSFSNVNLGLPQINFLPINLYLRGSLQRYNDFDYMKINSSLAVNVFPISISLNYFHEIYNNKSDGVFSQYQFFTNRMNISIPSISGFFSFINGMRFSPFFSYDLTNGKFIDFGSGFERRLFKNTSLSVSYYWNILSDFQRIQIGLRLSTSYFNASTSALIEDERIKRFNSDISGAISFDSDDFSFYFSNPMSNEIGISAVKMNCFVDNNNNRIFDDDEMLLDEVNFSIEGTNARKHRDESNIYFNVLPYEQYNAYLDSSSIDDPVYMPLFSKFSFIPDPNSIKAINIPCYPSGIAEGAVIRVSGDSKTGQKGVKIHIVSVDSAVALTVPVFSDGSFYYMGLPPGDYSAKVDSLQLAILDVRSEPEVMRFTVRKTKDGDFVSGLKFELYPLKEQKPIAQKPDSTNALQQALREAAIDTASKLATALPEKKKVEYEKVLERMESNVTKLFKYSSSRETLPTKEMKAYLDDVAMYLISKPKAELSVVGHADNFGAMEDTQLISDRRAQAVTKYLTERGVAAERIYARGEGSRAPIASNLSPEGRAKNRRIEIMIIE